MLIEDGYEYVFILLFIYLTHFQATIGIDFLSKTMYLEDRTVSFIFITTCDINE